MNVAIYLRKSRQDEELERELGEGSTLERHRKTLMQCAKARDLTISKIYEEVVSGESVIARPQMLELLKEVQSGTYEGILVMDIQRLGRGDMEDQGLILRAFKTSNTKIITPEKIYDLNQEFDETFTELQAFLSRQEYKLIKKRMWRGRVRSAEDGNYLCTWAPYGYLIQGTGKKRKLVPHPEQADIVRLIFNLYCNDGLGCQIIADRLNCLGIKTSRGSRWQHNQVRYILKNPVYTGMVVWMRQEVVKGIGTRKIMQRPESEWIIKENTHLPLVDRCLFERAQELMEIHYHPPVNPHSELVNPLAGLVICGLCGAKLKYRNYSKAEPHLICPEKCGNKSSKFKYIEAKLLDDLESMMGHYEIQYGNMPADNNPRIPIYLQRLRSMEKELKELQNQKISLFDFLERGIYSIDVFTERLDNINKRIDQAEENIRHLKMMIGNEEKHQGDCGYRIPSVQKILSSYRALQSPKEKNMLLKCVLEKVVYRKAKDQKRDSFELEITYLF